MFLPPLADVDFVWEGWNLPGSLILLTILGLLAVHQILQATLGKKKARTPVTAAVAEPATSFAPKGQSSPNILLPAPATPKLEAWKSRRKHLRREGNPVPVRICTADASSSIAEGVVENRSRGGLGISVPTSLSVGAILNVQPASSPEELWVQVEVRHCRPKGDHYYVGCKFREELPWSVLLQFG